MKSLLLWLTAAFAAVAQDKPLASPHAIVTQTIGTTVITVDYHRPAVKGRKIWGDLVKYGEVWRTGANQNTTIALSGDVRIEGKVLKAGTYGLHTIPGESEWTIIFSNDARSWGSYSYDEKKDALRVKVRVQAGDFVERMRFTFDDMTDNTCLLVLQWEKIKIPVSIGI